MAASREAIDLGASLGAAVLGMLERASVPPKPPFYRLVYDYVSGVRGLGAARVGDILNASDAQNGAAGEQLYSEFIAPYENTETFDRAVAAIVGRLKTLDQLIGESVADAKTQSASLQSACDDLAGGQLDAELLRDWVWRIEDTNRQMRDGHEKLTAELDTAQLELDAIKAEMQSSRAGLQLDPLTGLKNRGGLDAELERLLAAGNEHLCYAAIDIDHFKSLNDSYGHPVGDEVLRIVARGLQASARADDVVGRCGGDEFVVLLPGARLSAAHNVADGMRAAIAAGNLSDALGSDVLGGITISVGVSEHRAGDTPRSFVERADRCLYRAKQNGRNRVDSTPPADEKPTSAAAD